jgi:catalase
MGIKEELLTTFQTRELYFLITYIKLVKQSLFIRFSGPQPNEMMSLHKEKVSGDVARYETGDEDNFTQCGQFFRKVLSQCQRERLTDNIAGSLIDAQDFIQLRAIANFAAADQTYGRMVRDKLEVLKKKRHLAKKTSKPSLTNALSPPRIVSKL